MAAGASACRRGFTLLEILLTIAIIALLGGALIGGSAKLLNQQAVSASEVFWKSVQEARKIALRSGHEVRLKYDKEKKQFVLIDGLARASVGPDGIAREESPLKVFPVAAETNQDLTVEFLGPATKGATAILVGGMLLESNPVPFVRFYSDGTCMAFRVQLARGGAVTTLSVDPWTCAPVLTGKEENAL